MPVIDHLLGDIELRERRPKSWNEPRYKRLSFVRPHDSRSHSRNTSSSSNGDPNEWALAPPQGTHNSRYRNDAETWDLRRHEAQGRFHEAEIRHRDLKERQRIHFIHQLYGPPPNLQHIHDRAWEQGRLDGERIQEIRPRRGSIDSMDEIVAVESGDDWDDFDDHHRRPRRQLEADHDRGRAVHDLTGHGKKGKKGKKDKGHKRSKSHGDSDSDEERKVFVKGVKVGLRLSRERGTGHGGGSDRGSPRNNRRFLRGDDSDDSMDFRPRRRSRSRGRPFWGM